MQAIFCNNVQDIYLTSNTCELGGVLLMFLMRYFGGDRPTRHAWGGGYIISTLSPASFVDNVNKIGSNDYSWR